MMFKGQKLYAGCELWYVIEDVDDLEMSTSGRADLRGFIWADPSATSSPVLLARFLEKIIVKVRRRLVARFRSSQSWCR